VSKAAAISMTSPRAGHRHAHVGLVGLNLDDLLIAFQPYPTALTRIARMTASAMASPDCGMRMGMRGTDVNAQPRREHVENPSNFRRAAVMDAAVGRCAAEDSG